MLDVLFLPECNADTALIELLVDGRCHVEHVQGIHDVVAQMKITAMNRPGYRVIGVVDDDSTNLPTDFDNFLVVSTWERIVLKQHKTEDRYLIVLSKAIETFVLWNAAQVNIQVELYGFSSVLRQFCKALKRDSIQFDPDYLRLLTDLRTRQAPGILTLDRLLNDLIVTP